MNKINPQAFEYALSRITDGFLFERFAQDLLCQILGHEFIPIGKVKDRGIDGLEHCSSLKDDPMAIYQISIEVDPKTKISKTIKVLKENKIKCDRLFYVTNRIVNDQDQIEEDLYKEFKVVVRCRDAAWLRGNVNKTEGTIRTYLSFIESHFHEFVEPGKSLIVTDFSCDPRIFVFLRQQWEQYGHKVRIDDLLTDSLILFSLEGTDPDKGKFMSRDEMLAKIAHMVSFSPKNVEACLDKRLTILSSKPRRINHHRETNKYCLPYATRLELEEQNLADKALHDSFNDIVEKRLKEQLSNNDVRIKDALNLLTLTFNRIFKQQGLEFADFVIKAENRNAVEKSLPDIISEVVDSSSVIPKNRQRVKTALLGTIREIIYKGSEDEREYLRRLANSYMMLFLVQCDPKISAFFATLASKLNVFVCTSIIIPAISEFPLQPEHRRHWNLLVNAKKAGVELLINKVILSELVGHFRKVISLYETDYKGNEQIYANENGVRYVDEILLRSYFYGIINGRTWSLDEFIDNFVTPKASDDVMQRELIEWLRANFGIKYVEDASLGVKIQRTDHAELSKELEPHKPSKQSASNDAHTILTIYALREKNNETGTGGIFGYRTWWLSKDTLTQRAVNKCFGKRYPTSCYIRPDFLLNYISLAPTTIETDRVFDRMFPTLMGVTISHHMPSEITALVHDEIKNHSEKGIGRIQAAMGTLTDRLKTEPIEKDRKHLKHYLDELFEKS